MQTAGVLHYLEIELRDLKRELLVFDKMAVLHLDEGIAKAHRPFKKELKWLRDAGLLIEAREISRAFDLATSGKRDLLGKDAREALDLGNALRAHVGQNLEKYFGGLSMGDAGNLLHKVTMLNIHCLCRAIAAEARNEQQLDAAAIGFPWLFADQSSPDSPDKSNVLRIVLENLPTPSDGTPWEQIVDFRSDPDSKRKISALKIWMRKIAKGNIGRIECEEELQHLRHEYENHMRIHKMKTSRGAIEVVITTIAEIAGNIASFKWGDAVKPLFSIDRKRIELLEAEAKAPGSEIAYILKANEAFSVLGGQHCRPRHPEIAGC